MSDEVKPVPIEIAPLRNALQQFNNDLGIYINEEQRFKLGRVLTIIDASIADAEQRKAVKDLINNEWWYGNSTRLSTNDNPMQSPHSDLRALCEALGFKLFPPKASDPDVLPVDDISEFAIKRYSRVVKQEQ